MERKRIPKEYYRDSKCETIESVIRKKPRYIDWQIMRFRSSGGLSDYEDSFEIRNERGKPIIVFSESEIDFLISTDSLLSVLDNLRMTGFFLRFSPRSLNVIFVLIILIPFAILIPALMYIMSLPEDQALLGLVAISIVYLFYIVILVISQGVPHRSELRFTSEKNRKESDVDRASSNPFEKLKELNDLKRNNPMEYIRRLRELTDKQSHSSPEQEN